MTAPTEAPDHHGTELTVHGRADEPTHRQSPRPLLFQQIARAKKLMLVPVARHERRRLGERFFEVLYPVDVHHAARAQPALDDAQSDRNG